MSSRRALPVLVLAAWGCLPDNPDATATDAASTGDPGTTDPVEPTETGGPSTGLFACSSPPCTLLLVSQTLDDRIDIFETAPNRGLRGRIDLDLKDDPSGKQITGNLLDEPYDLVLTDTELIATVGHYPDTALGSLLRFPRTSFAELEPGGTFTVDRYFAGGTFSGGVEDLAHGRREGIFLLPHPSGRLLVGVFANDLKTLDWSTPSELLVVDTTMFTADAVGSFDLGGLQAPCNGGWRLEPLDAAVSKVAVACDGSESIAVLTLPDDLGTASPTDAAAGITGCGGNLGGGAEWSTQFVAGDGAGGMLAVQSQLGDSPRLWHINANCSPSGKYSDPPTGDLQAIRPLRQPVLVRPQSGDGAAMWLIAVGPPSGGVAIVRGGATPELCGRVAGLELIDPSNAPFALAVDASRQHLAIGAGPPNQPELADGRGQVLWATLDLSRLDACEVTASDVVDLNGGLFQNADPLTWVRAPNVLVIAELGGAG